MRTRIVCDTSLSKLNRLLRGGSTRYERVDLGRNATYAKVLSGLLARYEELRRTEVSRAAAGLCIDVPDGCVANEKSGVWQPWVDSS